MGLQREDQGAKMNGIVLSFINSAMCTSPLGSWGLDCHICKMRMIIKTYLLRGKGLARSNVEDILRSKAHNDFNRWITSQNIFLHKWLSILVNIMHHSFFSEDPWSLVKRYTVQFINPLSKYSLAACYMSRVVEGESSVPSDMRELNAHTHIYVCKPLHVFTLCCIDYLLYKY